MVEKFLSFALIILALVMGAHLWHHLFEKPRIITTTEWFDRPVVIAPKTIAKVGTTPKSDSVESAHRDSIIMIEPCDSLRALASEKLQPFMIFSADSVAASDSLGGFSALELIQIEADPMTRIISFTRSFQDAIMRLSRVSTTETVTEINWYSILGSFILGLLAAIVLLH